MMIKKISSSLKIFSAIAGVAFIGATANAGTWQSDQVIGGNLSAHLYIPSNPALMVTGRALMVNLHGCNQTHDDLKNGGNWEPSAELYGAVIAIPKASGEGVAGSLLGCWNFHVGMNADRNESDAKYLISLVNTLTNDPSLNIDPSQVFISGFSAGGSMANQMACLAPDIFAGAGVVAGLAPGATGISSPPPIIPIGIGKDNCETLAGPNKSALYRQKYSYVIGTDDAVLNPAHAEENIQVFREVYAGDGNGLAEVCSIESLSGGGDLTTYCDEYHPVISKIVVNGMGHAWPAGSGSFGNDDFIDYNHINYPRYLADFFFNFEPHPPTPVVTPTPTVTPTPVITPSPTPTLIPIPHPCFIETSSNWLHKLAGRAYSTGFWWAPNYYAKFSDDPMDGSTWGETTLYSMNGGQWYTTYICLTH